MNLIPIKVGQTSRIPLIVLPDEKPLGTRDVVVNDGHIKTGVVQFLKKVRLLIQSKIFVPEGGRPCPNAFEVLAVQPECFIHLPIHSLATLRIRVVWFWVHPV